MTVKSADLRLALDANVLVYAEGLQRHPADVAKVERATQLAGALGVLPTFIPRQALSELHRVMVRKAGATPERAADIVRRWARRAVIIDTDAVVFETALGLAAEHRLAIFDAIILAAAGECRADLLLSEDLHDGLAFHGVTVANPFATRLEPRLVRLLA